MRFGNKKYVIAPHARFALISKFTRICCVWPRRNRSARGCQSARAPDRSSPSARRPPPERQSARRKAAGSLDRDSNPPLTKISQRVIQLCHKVFAFIPHVYIIYCCFLWHSDVWDPHEVLHVCLACVAPACAPAQAPAEQCRSPRRSSAACSSGGGLRRAQ
jgi:hypothetical protein